MENQLLQRPLVFPLFGTSLSLCLFSTWVFKLVFGEKDLSIKVFQLIISLSSSFLHMQHKYNTINQHFLRLFVVKILSKEVVRTKKDAFRGSFICHVFFYGKVVIPGFVRTWWNVTVNLPFLEGSLQFISSMVTSIILMEYSKSKNSMIASNSQS